MIRIVNLTGSSLCGAVALFVLAGSVAAAELRVGPDEEHASVQAAIDAAADGDRIVVAPGQYAERLTIVDKSLALVVSDEANSDGDTAAAVIDADNSGTALTIEAKNPDAATVTIEGLTLTRGKAEAGGGVQISGATVVLKACRIEDNWADRGGGLSLGNGAVVTLEDCTIDGNAVNLPWGGNYQKHHGGGLFVGAATLTLRDCTVSNNRATWGGGLMLRRNATATIEDTIFQGNQATSHYAQGGAIGAESAKMLTIDRSRFEKQLSRNSSGGAIMLRSTPMTLRDSVLVDNQSSTSGGAVYAAQSPVRIERCLFARNQTSGDGGALALDASDATLTGCIFSGNRASQFGGALYAYALDDGRFFGNPQITVAQCLFVNNQSEAGGGLALVEPIIATLEHVTIARNAARHGGGVLAMYSDVSLRECVVGLNEAAGVGAQFFRDAGTLTIEQSVVEGGPAAFGGYADTPPQVSGLIAEAPAFARPTAAAGLAGRDLDADWELNSGDPAHGAFAGPDGAELKRLMNGGL